MALQVDGPVGAIVVATEEDDYQAIEAGIAGSTISGLIFGIITVYGGWSIWPAALAHGVNNTIGIIAIFNGL